MQACIKQLKTPKLKGIIIMKSEIIFAVPVIGGKVVYLSGRYLEKMGILKLWIDLEENKTSKAAWLTGERQKESL